MIINGFKCEGCGEELQADDISVGINTEGNMVRICRFCNYVTEVELKSGDK